MSAASSVGGAIADDFRKWGAEEAILEKIKQFIESGRPTRLDISPQLAMFYLLFDDPTIESETIASKLIGIFVKNPNPAIQERFLKFVDKTKQFGHVPIWFHDYLVKQSLIGRRPVEWREEFREFLLS